MSTRKRTGFTLLEVLTVVTIMAAVFLGFTVLLYDMAEQMHISWQLREAEEWGSWYVNQFIDKVRNGNEPLQTRITAPSELQVVFLDPYYYKLPPPQRDDELWEFEYSYRSGMPQIRIDDQVYEYEFFPPENLDSRDEFYVDPESFVIRSYNDPNLPQQYQRFRDSYYTLSFEITYRHHSVIPGKSTYERVIPVTGSAYVINENWPVIEPPPGFDDDD